MSDYMFRHFHKNLCRIFQVANKLFEHDMHRPQHYVAIKQMCAPAARFVSTLSKLI